MRFIWFLNFWGWSRESHRAGLLLRHPLEGIGGNWDEWFNGEASAAEQKEIAEVGQSEPLQREFLTWLGSSWIEEAVHNDNRLALPFVLEELARVAPFDRWKPFVAASHAPQFGIAAVVLADQSTGEASDVRGVDAILLPLNGASTGRAILAEGFSVETADLSAAREAALSALRGSGLWRLLVIWLLTGRRPYKIWAKLALVVGWIGAGTLFAWLWLGPEPGDWLPGLSAGLLGLWSGLVIIALVGAGLQFFQARRAGKQWAEQITRGQIRLKMPGRLILKGSSAGLPFALSILSAVTRAYPHLRRGSWVWRGFIETLQSEGSAWAATGIVTKEGQVQPVRLESKIKACLLQGEIRHLLTPRQREANGVAVNRMSTEAKESLTTKQSGTQTEPVGRRNSALMDIQRCRHLADAVSRIARWRSVTQALVNGLAFVVSGLMLCALPDLCRILNPPAPPAVVAPASPSPYFLWVSLDTRSPDFFQVVLESKAWVNRRADIARRTSLPASTRAEIRLVRVSQVATRDFEDGVVWIERRPCFLNRKFEPGEVVGRYTIAYINRLSHD